MARWRSGNAGVCKTSMHGFESRSRLNMHSKKEFEEETIEGEFGKEQTQRNPRSELDQEILAGEWEKLTQNEVYRNRSRSGKIIAMHQAITNRIKELEKLFYPMVRDFPQKAEKLLEQIKKLRALQQFLLQAYAWEKQGVLTDEDIPEELEEFL